VNSTHYCHAEQQILFGFTDCEKLDRNKENKEMSPLHVVVCIMKGLKRVKTASIVNINRI